MAVKQELTAEEVIRVAYGHFILGIEQQSIAAMFGVNSGRVSEACQAIWATAEDPREAYRALKKEENAHDETA